MEPPFLVGFGDADAFYSSAEAVRHPWLKGKPVGVLGNQGACVIARSYAMKRYGIKVGEPIWEAKQKCPHGIYIKRDFKWYESLSRRLLEEVGTFGPHVEYYSIDEFFWRGYRKDGLTYQQTAIRLRDHLKAKLGLPVTVAFARTRTLAKLFADVAKPFGAIAIHDPDEVKKQLATIPITEIAGIAARRARRLEPYGIRTCLDLANASGPLIRKVLTVVGEKLWLELNGIPGDPIRAERSPHKMIARGGSLAGRVHDPYTLYGWMVRNVERLIEELQYHQVRTKELVVYVSYFENGSAGGSTRFLSATDRFDELLEAAKSGLSKVWRPGLVATHLHLIASKLVRPAGWERLLFDDIDPKKEAIAQVKREINERYGRFRLRSGATLFANAFYKDRANEYDICDVRGKVCF
jgi:DNA polymerase V